MSVSSILTHLGGRGGVSGIDYHLVIVVLRGAARVELQVEVLGSGEGDSFFELVVVSYGVDCLHETAGGPGGRDLDVGELP